MAGAVPVRHKTTGEDRFTTPAVLQAHGKLDAALRGLADARIGAIADAVPAGLTDNQKRAFRYETAAGGKLRTIHGRARHGQDPADARGRRRLPDLRLPRARRLDRQFGGRVLRTDTDVLARSVAWRRGSGRKIASGWGPCDLRIIDEALTVGTACARHLMQEAGHAVPSYAVGRPSAIPGRSPTATRSVRPRRSSRALTCKPVCQKAEWQARATEERVPGRIRAGLDAYNRNGLVHQHATQAEACAGSPWLKATERGGVDRDAVDCGIETLTIAERIELNALARKAKGELGRLHGPDVSLETLDGPDAL